MILQHEGRRLDLPGTGEEQIGEILWDPELGREEWSPFLLG